MAWRWPISRRAKRAISIARRGLQITRKYGTFYFAIAAAAAHLGRMDEAGAAVTELLNLREDYSIARRRAASGYADTPGTQRLFDGLSLAGLPEGEA